MTSTIAAIASPPGPGLRGVIRISGPLAADLVLAAVRPADPAALAARSVLQGELHDTRGTQPVLLFWMPAPRSYTREDVAELHLPGAPPLLAAAFERLLELGAEAAGPGEFTRRAFLNGRLDLTEAEGVLELVDATNEAERRAACQLFEGGLSDRVAGLRERVEELRALCEASLDFDEADTGHVPAAELAALARRAMEGLEEALGWEVRRQPPSALPRVLLFGAPNAGKSSLFNALSGDARALVSGLAGTTRDSLHGLWQLAGEAALLVDAPGLERGAVGPDARAQELAARGRESFDLVLWVVDASAPDPAARRREATELAGLGERPRVLVLWHKVDRPDVAQAPPQDAAELLGARAGPAGPVGPSAVVATSVERPETLAELARRVARELGWGVRGGGRGAAVGRELFLRHRQALGAAREALAEGTRLLAQGAPLDLVAEAWRDANRALDSITGRSGVEELLGRIFARFCIGK